MSKNKLQQIKTGTWLKGEKTMIKITYLKPQMLIADEGKMLTNGEVYTSVIYLGKDENIDNWQEINADEVPNESEVNEE